MTIITASKGPASFHDCERVEGVENPKAWRPLLVTRREMRAQIERLADLPGSDERVRSTLVVHPEARAPGLGTTPGLAISLNVLRPGESAALKRDNASRIEFGIGGEGRIGMRGSERAVSKFDAWTIPSMSRRTYRNESSELLVWLSYSNVPLLQKMGIHYADEEGATTSEAVPMRPSESEQRYIREAAPDIPILGDGARLRGYEYLTDIEAVENRPLLWPWKEVRPLMSAQPGDGKRTIMLLYNPATRRRNGTTHSFFATVSVFPEGAGHAPPPRGHKHSSFACNYHFMGAGRSIVDGELFEWEAGDLMLSAPSWSEHSHGISPQGAGVLTVQDHPLQIAMESLIWQERMDGPILMLGSEPGQTGYVGPRLAGD